MLKGCTESKGSDEAMYCIYCIQVRNLSGGIY